MDSRTRSNIYSLDIRVISMFQCLINFILIPSSLVVVVIVVSGKLMMSCLCRGKKYIVQTNNGPVKGSKMKTKKGKKIFAFRGIPCKTN